MSVICQLTQFRAVLAPPLKSHFSPLLLGQVKTSDVISWVRSRRKKADVMSLADGPPLSHGSGGLLVVGYVPGLPHVQVPGDATEA